jgi:hypothetical protein
MTNLGERRLEIVTKWKEDARAQSHRRWKEKMERKAWKERVKAGEKEARREMRRSIA